MRQREKILALIVGSVVVLGLVAWGLSALVLKPVRVVDRQISGLRDRLNQINNERRAFFTNETFIKSVVQRSFGRDPDGASAQVGKLLTDELLQLGLSDQAFTRTPFGPQRLKGAQEFGWNIQGEGPLPKIIDLLFVLDQTPQVHRLDSLVLSAGEKPGRVRARFRYLSVVVDRAPLVTPAVLKPPFDLNSPERRAYDPIVARDLLRPYVKRRESPAPAATETAKAGASGPAAQKVISLSLWQGVPDIAVCDLSNLKVTHLKPGDPWAEGQVVTVDYRTLPLPGHPELFSNSRLILKSGTNYWAIEEGQTAADKYLLSPTAWPPALAKP